MKAITFTVDREFDYGHGVVLHAAGDVVAVHAGGAASKRDAAGAISSIRDDKAQRWLTRGAAVELKGRPDDKSMARPADVVGADSGGAGERPFHVAAPGANPVAAPAAAKPAGRGRK